MTHIWHVFRYEFIKNITRKGYLLATFGIPLIALVAVYGFHTYQTMQVPSEDDNQALETLLLEDLDRAGYVDYSGLFATVPDRFASVLTRFDDESSAEVALSAGEIDLIYVFSADYLESGDVMIRIPNLAITLLSEGQRLLDQFIYNSLAPDLNAIELQRLTRPATFSQVNLSLTQEDESTEESSMGEFFTVYIFMFVFFIGLMMTNSYLMQTVIEERNNKLMEILISSIRPTSLLAGKILAMALLGICQIVIWVISVLAIVNYAGTLSTYQATLEMMNLSIEPSMFAVMAVFFVLTYLLYAAVFGGIGAISGSTQEGSQYIGLVVIPTILPYYFFPLLQSDPNGTLATVFTMIPFTAPITVLIRLVMGSMPFWQLVLSAGILSVGVGGAIWFAGRLFRVQTLLAGQGFKFKEIPNLLFKDHIQPKKAS